jgi:8-oxo-dGTP diphosphatase
MRESKFIIRVYGIYINGSNGLLVSDEFIKGINITKFPGGGLEFGEGTIECLIREMWEETGCEFEIDSHFYTTDFFVESAFDSNRQVVSIYYMMKPVGKLNISISEIPFDFLAGQEGAQSFRFIPLEKVNPDQFTLPIDRHVALLLSDLHK